MHEEVKLGASYIVRLLNRHQKLDSLQVERFTTTLTSILCDKFEGHWYPDSPQKGQAYRCIRIEHNTVLDDSVLRACMQSGLRCSQLAFPKNMSIWIDPQEVSCRLGESCSPFIVKAPEESKKTTEEKPEQDTSDYHSEGSDVSGSPSECSSEDEESSSGKKKSPVIDTQKIGAQYYYSPAPSSTIFYQYPNSAVSFVPAYQPMTLYYLVPKYYHNIRSQSVPKKWKSKKSSPPIKS
ncbi:protein BTG3-like [Hyla sarda]|uniref:protein BTG3-like n=1 Tax=Hyla sarda TaxID=327740 RepID=UPI0024C32FCF|nr:protein BTG3-like [Hyla sarda]XP_056399597.1 protein BTG3-like [Hyla sarda]XP_056399598.1 protein BTG3-like [Hyla sarda]